jgi:DNA helicase-4
MQYVIWSAFIIAAVLFIAGAINNSKKKYQDENYLKNLEIIRKFFEEIESFDDYVTWKQRDAILGKYSAQHEFFEGKSNYYSGERDVEKFNVTYENFKRYVDGYNDSYVNQTIEQNGEFFDDIEGNSLDHQQREAVVTDEYSNLVIAGAGSGKTLTILGKVLFLTKIKKVHPERILLMSYQDRHSYTQQHRSSFPSCEARIYCQICKRYSLSLQLIHL